MGEEQERVDLGSRPAEQEAFPTRGSGEPAEDDEPASADFLDPARLEQGGGLPRVDAMDAGESGAPTNTLDTGSGSGPGAGARHEGGAGGSGARVADQRARGEAVKEDEEEPAAGGPSAGDAATRGEELA